MVDDPEATVAELLANGEIVARFADREEFGARALGNRSILADPSDPKVVRTINEMIKMRDFWMPFACSILHERSDKYIVNPKSMTYPYMIITFDTTELRHELLAGMHPFDYTVRPQEVSRTANPRYHRLISLFEEYAGRGVILNTSFNLHGEPIVHSPEDAIEVLCRSGLTHLMLENILIQKNTSIYEQGPLMK
jgi:carbamoyltransferase